MMCEVVESTGFFSDVSFSVEWIDGTGSEVNKEGVAYYNKLIDGLLQKGIILDLLWSKSSTQAQITSHKKFVTYYE